MRYTVTITFKGSKFEEREIENYRYDPITNYYLNRLPKVEKVECKTQAEVNEWRKIINDSVISFNVKDNVNGKIIYSYPH